MLASTGLAVVPVALIILIMTWTVAACLRAIAFDADRAARWHDLKVRVQVLRREQRRRLEALTCGGSAPRTVRAKETRAAPDAPTAIELPEEEGAEVTETASAA